MKELSITIYFTQPGAPSLPLKRNRVEVGTKEHWPEMTQVK